MFRLFRSLRWRLQAWHAIILFSVIVVFGSLLHWEMLRAQWDRVDDEMLGAARILEGSMNAVPATILEAMAKDVTSRAGPRRRMPMANRPRRDLPATAFQPGPPQPGPLQPGTLQPGTLQPGTLQPGTPQPGPPQLERPRDRPMLDWQFPRLAREETPELTQEEWEASIELPHQLPGYLGRQDGSAFFVIWRADGSILKESQLPSDMPSPTDVLSVAMDRDRYARQQRGQYREVFIRGPYMTTICVGRPVGFEQSNIARMTWTLVLSGLSVFCVGLIGGWWFTKRAIEPIQRMSKMAQRVSASSLSERIDIAGCDTELEGLGASLNTMLDRLAQSFEQQRQFTADASHEFRTPLSVMLASSELALSKPRSADEYREQLLKCQRAARRMQELGASLLVLARLDANANLELHPVDVNAMLTDAIDSIRPLADEKKVAIVSEMQPLLHLLGNASMLRQAVDNVLSNAIKYNEPNGQVTVRAKDHEDMIEIEIEDSGIGIPESAIPSLFDRFYRVDESRSRAAGGTGLGLSIVQQIVKCHRGRISVTSTLGKGTTFRIALPKQLS